MFNVETNFRDYPDILSTNQAKEILHIGKSKIYELLQDEVIKSIRIGRDYKIPKQSIIDYLNSKIVA